MRMYFLKMVAAECGHREGSASRGCPAHKDEKNSGLRAPLTRNKPTSSTTAGDVK